MEAWNALELSATPFAVIGTARLLTAAKTVEPLVASWDSMPPNTPGSRLNLAGSGMGEVGVAFSVSSPAFSCPRVHADRELPHQLAGLRAQFDQDAGLAAVDDHRLPMRGGEHRRVLQVPVDTGRAG